MHLVEDHSIESKIDVEIFVMVVMEPNRWLPWPHRVKVDPWKQTAMRNFSVHFTQTSKGRHLRRLNQAKRNAAHARTYTKVVFAEHTREKGSFILSL